MPVKRASSFLLYSEDYADIFRDIRHHKRKSYNFDYIFNSD